MAKTNEMKWNDNVKTMLWCETGHLYEELSHESAATRGFMERYSEFRLVV